MAELCGYAGRILRVNLSNNKIWMGDTGKYEGNLLGGGIVARIAWNELKPNIDPFSPQSKLIIMTGPLTGVLSPGSERTTVAGSSASLA